MNRLHVPEDPEMRRYRRIASLMSAAVCVAFIGGLAAIGSTVPVDPPALAVNCAVQPPGAVFDDSGAHDALCAGHGIAPRRVAEARPAWQSPPSSDALASDTSHPPTF